MGANKIWSSKTVKFLLPTFCAALFILPGYLLFEANPPSSKITNIKFKTLADQPFQFSDNDKALLIYYINPATDCSTCISDINDWNRYIRTYENVHFASLHRGSGAHRIKSYESYLSKIKFTGNKLVDHDSKLQKQYSIAEGASILAFDRNKDLIGMIRFDDLTFKDRKRYLSRVLSKLDN